MRVETLSAAAPRITVRSPASRTVIGTVPILDAAAVSGLVARARAAQPAWAALTRRQRARAIMQFRARLADRAAEVAALSCAETGKLPLEALLSDVQVTCDLAKWYARRSAAVLGRRRVPAGWMITK